MGEVSLGTVYDMNKTLMEKEPSMSVNALNKKINKINKFFARGEYFMLLCHEARDYTVFQITGKNPDLAGNELKECLKNRGIILAIDEVSGNAYEIWIKNEEGIFAYYLFPYDAGIIIC